MNKLEKARDRLIELRGLAAAGPWKAVSWKETWTPGTEHTVQDSTGEVIAYAGDYASSEATFPPDTAALIATLYATLDAQIALLDQGIAYKDLHDGMRDAQPYLEPWKDTQIGKGMYDLAKSILKGA